MMDFFSYRKALHRSRMETERLRRIWLFQALETLNVDPTSEAGLDAIDRYRLYVDDEHGPENGEADMDFSLLRLGTWLLDRHGIETHRKDPT